MIRCTSSSCCGLQVVRSVSIRFRMSRGSSSRSNSRRVLGWSRNPLAIATIVSRLGTFFPRSTSPQKLPVMLPRSAASSRLSFAAFRSRLTRCANSVRCFTSGDLHNHSRHPVYVKQSIEFIVYWNRHLSRLTGALLHSERVVQPDDLMLPGSWLRQSQFLGKCVRFVVVDQL